jgi:uncharacterized protein YacL (UPF0231 family)
MSIRRMTTKQLKKLLRRSEDEEDHSSHSDYTEAEDDHTSDSDYVEELSSSESEYEDDAIVDDEMMDDIVRSYRTRRSVGPKPDAYTIEITAIKNNLTKEIREKKQKNKEQTKKMSKVRGYKRVRILDGTDWTSSMDTDRIRTRSEHKRFQEERNIHEDMLNKLQADGHVLRYNEDMIVLRSSK